MSKAFEILSSVGERMEISIVPEFHAKDIASWLQVYVPGKPDLVIKGRANEPFKFELSEVDASSTLCVWWYVHRLFQLDKFVGAGRESKETKNRLVMTEKTHQRAGTGETLLGDGSKFALLDIERQVVARGQVKSTFAPLPGKVLEAKGAGGGELWLSVVNKLHREDARFNDTNATELARHTFGSVVAPFGTMPTWVYPYFASIRARNAVAEYGDTLDSLFVHACYFTFTDPDKFDRADRDQRIETICEMQTMATRFLVYARDTSMRLGVDHLVDDWTRIADTPDPSMIVYDCEDGSEEAMAQSTALRLAKGLTGGLAEAQRLELLYYSCFAVITLRLGSTKNWVYHAVLFKFDRRWLQRKLGLKVDGGTHAELPPCLLETTAWTTSNWKHRTKAYSEKTYYLAEDFIEANTKVPAELVIRQGLYGHLLTLTCPELLDTHRIGQIECVFRGKLGVPVPKVMTAPADDGIEFVACYTDAETVRGTTTNLSQLLPETRMMLLPEDFKAGAPRRENYTAFPKTQFVVRNRDFEDPEIKARVLAAAAKMGSGVKVDVVTVYGTIGGVNVIVT